MEHLAYLVPFNKELNVPYRAPEELKDKIKYVFSHPKVPKAQRNLFIEVSKSGSKQLVNDMGCVAIAMTRHFVENPQQYANCIENIHFQLLRRMWKQVFNHLHKQENYPDLDDWKYLGIKYRMLSIENGLLDELIRVVKQEDYVQDSKDMRKHDRPAKKSEKNGLLVEGSKHFEYLCTLE